MADPLQKKQDTQTIGVSVAIQKAYGSRINMNPNYSKLSYAQDLAAANARFKKEYGSVPVEDAHIQNSSRSVDAYLLAQAAKLKATYSLSASSEDISAALRDFGFVWASRLDETFVRFYKNNPSDAKYPKRELDKLSFFPDMPLKLERVFHSFGGENVPSADKQLFAANACAAMSFLLNSYSQVRLEKSLAEAKTSSVR